MPEPNVLSPGYKPAQADSKLSIRFMGNTAQIADAVLGNVDPFQMLAAAEWLRMKGLQFIQQAEMKAAKEAEDKGIKVATNLPPGGFKQER